MNNQTTSDRKSERELLISRHFNASPRAVFEAWTKPEILKRWWTPKSYGLSLVSCEVDARTGGHYRFGISHRDSPKPMEFFGKYLEVVPNSRLVWTNEESGENGQITTVTFEAREGKTLLVMSELYPTKEALEEAMGSGGTAGCTESFDQLEELFATLPASAKH